MQTTCIAFLRAVNVGGRTVKMDRLRALLGDLGLEGVRTYIQSGNVFFREEAGADRAALAARIEEHLEEALGFAVPAVLRTVDEVAAALEGDPFGGVTVTEDIRLCVVFLTGPVPPGTTFPVVSPKGDFTLLGLTAAGDAHLVVDQSKSGGRPGNPAAFMEKTFGPDVQATSRFFHTLEKIVAAARKDD